jgi:hypothetical protein
MLAIQRSGKSAGEQLKGYLHSVEFYLKMLSAQLKSSASNAAQSN